MAGGKEGRLIKIEKGNRLNLFSVLPLFILDNAMPIQILQDEMNVKLILENGYDYAISKYGLDEIRPASGNCADWILQ